MKRIKLILLLLCVSTLGSIAQVNEGELKKNYTLQEVSPSELENWNFYGYGKAFNEGHKQFCVAEADETKGAMIVSPNKYGEDVIIRYKTMSLTPAGVLVAILSATDFGASEELTVPQDYDGSMPFWRDKVDCYFFAYRNAPHNFAPFVRKYPKKDNTALGSAKENVMQVGIYHDVEVGRSGKNLWLKVDGKLLFKATDENPLSGGHIAFRTRGTAGFKGAFLMKDLKIYYKQ